MPIINFNDIPHLKIWDGIHGAISHSDDLTFGHITLEKGAILPEHHHLQEQWVALMMKGGKPIRRLDRPYEDRPYLTPALIDVTEYRIRQRLWRDADTNAFLDSTLSAMESGAATPFTVADDLLSRSVDLLTRTRS